MLIDIDQIKIKKRIRKNIGDIETLKNSIIKHGLIYPIIIDKNKKYQALKEIGYKEAEVKVISSENKKTLLEIELDENNVRKSFTKSEANEGEAYLKIYSESNVIIRFIKFIILKIKNMWKRKNRKI
uniref:ParB N-terminal domain-containing protein n=1 Tax=Borreliella garinii TaxID=29519 RepID=UPI002277AFB5|nr:ParB N-terminal domain-containing protein [Borreliella garinii]